MASATLPATSATAQGTRARVSARRPGPRGRRGGAREGKRRGGNLLIEMLFLMPVLLGLSFGAAEYGYAMFVKHTLLGAAREGARAAVVSGAKATDVQLAVDRAMEAGGFGIATNNFNTARYVRPCSVTPSNFTEQAMGTSITVSVSARWSAIGIRLLPQWLGGIPANKTLTVASAMRKEG